MEAKINIAEILRNKPHGIRLYSPIFGNCTFCYIKDETSDICVRRPYNEMSYFNFEGLYNTAGECLLFPSKEMRDWSKFAWKKGDVLVGVGQRIIFEKFIDENYTEFQGKYSLSTYEDRTLVVDKKCYTSYFKKLDDRVNIENYFKEIEECLGDKLNRETLEVEKAQQKFQDGDILSCDEDSYTRHTTLILHKDKNITESIVSLIRHKELVKNVPINNFLLSRLYHAREDEKKELFDALAKKGKAWDAEKKQIVDLKEYQFKPFDKVLVRDDYKDEWRASFFSNIREGLSRYVTTGLVWKFCIPYEGNEHLLGTTNNVED